MLATVSKRKKWEKRKRKKHIRMITKLNGIEMEKLLRVHILQH